MTRQRPDLSQVEPAVMAYIEALEAALLRRGAADRPPSAAREEEPAFHEEPTTVNVITISAAGLAKRTPRHLYGRQRRAGMGVFGLETPEDDPAAHLALADAADALLLLTSFGRAFRSPVAAIVEGPLNGRGQSLLEGLPYRLQPGERLACAVPAQGGEFLALLSERGWVRRVRAAYLGERMLPGMSFHSASEGGFLAAACWTPGNADLFIATAQGEGIRFSEQQVPASGVRGMRVAPADVAVAIAAARPGGGVFMQAGDGKGTIRLMAGFSANKTPGAGGKSAMKTDRLIGAVAVDEAADLLILSRLGKVIRFAAAEVPAKEGVVQGVHCMSLRADETVAVVAG